MSSHRSRKKQSHLNVGYKLRKPPNEVLSASYNQDKTTRNTSHTLDV